MPLRRAGGFLTFMAVGTAVAFAVAPQGRLWNARLLPLWFLWLWLLVGVLVGEVAGFIAKAVRLGEWWHWAGLDQSRPASPDAHPGGGFVRRRAHRHPSSTVRITK